MEKELEYYDGMVMTRTNAQRGRYARCRGQVAERKVAIWLRQWFPDTKRGLQSRDGSECPDVIGTPFWIEVKARKKMPSLNQINKWFNQIKNNKSPLLFVIVDRQEWLIVYSLNGTDIVYSNRVDFGKLLNDKFDNLIGRRWPLNQLSNEIGGENGNGKRNC